MISRLLRPTWTGLLLAKYSTSSLLFCALVVLLTSSPSLADSDISGFGRRSKEEIFKLEQYPQLNLNELRAAWRKKCVSRFFDPEPCFLTEKDVSAQGSPNKVLLFRGEPGQYTTPGTSSYYRHYSKDKSVCAAECSTAVLSKKFQEDIQDLYVGVGPMSMRRSAYFRSPGVWVSENTELRRSSTPFKEVALHHLQGRGLYFEATKSTFDPFVSFSSSPAVAMSFASGKTILVASVPQEMIYALWEGDCNRSEIPAYPFYNLQGCSPDNPTFMELEVSAMFYLPQKYLYSIIILGK